VRRFLCLAIVLGAASCARTEPSNGVARAAEAAPAASSYFDNSGRDDVVTGGVKMIPIKTPKGTFNVWTKRVGNNPTMKVLLLHGGPGATHEYMEAFDSYFPAASIEYYYYDQLGSAYSDQPDDPSLLDVARFVDEVEQVIRAQSCAGGATKDTKDTKATKKKLFFSRRSLTRLT